MKIGFLFGNLVFGGSQLAAIEIMENLQKDVNVSYALMPDAMEDPRLLERLSRFQRLTMPDLLQLSNVIHFDGSQEKTKSSKILRSFDHKLIWYHGSAPSNSFFQKFSFRQSLPNAWHISCSEFVANSLDVPSLVVYSIDADKFQIKPKIKKRFDIVILGRLREVKNHELFLKVAKRGKYSFLVIGGSTTDFLGHENRIEAMIKASITPGVDLITGTIEQNEITSWIQQAKVGVVTSHSEGLGGNVGQVMASGLPVVARNVGGVREFYTPETDWLLVPKHSGPSAYVGRINKAIQNQEVGPELRKNVLGKYDQTRAMEQIIAFYRRKLGGQSDNRSELF